MTNGSLKRRWAPLAGAQLGIKIEQSDADAVQGVVENRARQAHLAYPEHRVDVDLHHPVINFRPKEHQTGVEDVNEEEQQDPDAAPAVQPPRPLTRSTAIHRGRLLCRPGGRGISAPRLSLARGEPHRTGAPRALPKGADGAPGSGGRAPYQAPILAGRDAVGNRGLDPAYICS